MPKQKLVPRQPSLFPKRLIPQMPEGYYSSGCKPRRYLQRIRVHKVRLSGFRPGKRTTEAGDVEMVVEEFLSFPLDNLRTRTEHEFPIGEIE